MPKKRSKREPKMAHWRRTLRGGRVQMVLSVQGAHVEFAGDLELADWLVGVIEEHTGRVAPLPTWRTPLYGRPKPRREITGQLNITDAMEDGACPSTTTTAP